LYQQNCVIVCWFFYDVQVALMKGWVKDTSTGPILWQKTLSFSLVNIFLLIKMHIHR